ncbi:hypothetical protein EB815_31730 [Mesorhizobium loti]|nr:hypothetical protein EB815_31730 [Mesorhizobium loti]
MEFSVFMSGVFDQHLMGSHRGLKVLTCLLPFLRRIDEPRAGGDNQAQIELDLVQETMLAASRIEAQFGRRPEQQFLALLPTDRRGASVSCRYRRYYQRTAERFEPECLYCLLRVWIFERPNEVHPRYRIFENELLLPHSPPYGVVVISRVTSRPRLIGNTERKRARLYGWDSLGAMLPPSKEKRSYLMSPPDFCSLLGTIIVNQDIVRRVFAELADASHRRNKPILIQGERTNIRCV